MPTQLWRPVTGRGLDRCEVEAAADGYRVSGTALLLVDEGPCEIRYSIVTNPAWVTTTVGAHVRGPQGDRRLALSSDGGGSWQVTDQAVPELAGATDVELAWTPAGHTVTISRLGLEVGDATEVTVVSVGFPRQDIARNVRRYERLAMRRYRVTAGDYETNFEVDEHSLLVAQPGRWVSVLDR